MFHCQAFVKVDFVAVTERGIVWKRGLLDFEICEDTAEIAKFNTVRFKTREGAGVG
jgi:hypothetical protein